MIGTRGWSFLSERPYAKYGMTAVIRLAEARFSASSMMSSSITLLFTGEQVG